MTRTAELADVVFPASNAAFESDGTVTNSERRVQRVRKALEPPGSARDDIWIIGQLADRLGADWGDVTAARGVGGAPDAEPDARRHELASASRSWAASSGPARTRTTPARSSCTPACGSRRSAAQGAKAPFSIVIDDPPVDELTEDFPLRLTTGRRLDSYNTGVQTGGYTSPLRRGETIDVSPEDADRMGLAEDECVLVSSRAAARWRCRCTSTRRCGPASCS